MSDNNLEFKASEVANLKGDAAKAGFINCFKEVQRFWTQLSQYTDLVEYTTDESPVLSDPVSGYGFTDDDLKAFRGAYLDLANSLKKRRDKKSNDTSAEIDELDFEFAFIYMDNNFESNYVKLEQSDIHIVFAPKRIIPLRQALAVRGLEPNEDEKDGHYFLYTTSQNIQRLVQKGKNPAEEIMTYISKHLGI